MAQGLEGSAQVITNKPENVKDRTAFLASHSRPSSS
jgi:hypothetical protein